MNKIRIGLMGLGTIGRQIYQQVLNDDRFEIVVISDIGQAEILRNLLNVSMKSDVDVELEDNYLVCEGERARLISANHPHEIPWDVFGVDIVIDATGKHRTREELRPHLENGAARVILSVLPEGDVDRVILSGVNDGEASVNDRIISAGSGSTTAAAIGLKVISDTFEIEHASMTSVHAYTGDQSLHDYAGPDYRRSRSGAKNIIPNETPALRGIAQALPALSGKLTGYALNVPVQVGSMLDLTIALANPISHIDEIRNLFIEAENARPDLIETTIDPIVSSDVKECSRSLLVDLQGTMQASATIIKLLGWHEGLGHAHRILDVAALYGELDQSEDLS